MAGYQIVTDSTTDITAEMIEDCGLVVIPLCFTLEGATHRDVPQGGMPIEGFCSWVSEQTGNGRFACPW